MPAMKNLLRNLLPLLALALSLAGCATIEPRPDLARLYEGESQHPGQPPVIVIHGLMGATLVHADTGEEFWPGSLGTLAFSDYRALSRMSEADREGQGLVPGKMIEAIGGVNFYSALVGTLETVGRFKRGTPGTPILANDRRRYYLLVYDWRRDNIEAVRKLHALVEQIRVDYGDPHLRVDIIAHSNGGLVANYYLRYGPRDVLDEGQLTPWSEGDKRIRRLVLLGTPSLGAISSLERIMRGYRFAVRTVPVEVMATFATPFQALPHPLVNAIIDNLGAPVDIDIHNPDLYRKWRWSVFSPEVEARVRASASTPDDGEKAIANLHAIFVRHLRRAERFQNALAVPVPGSTVETAVFGGDCKLTPGRAVFERRGESAQLAFNASEVAGKAPGVDYDRLLLEPGDGLVPRNSQVAKLADDKGSMPGRSPFFSSVQTFFLCESHEQLTGNPYFQNNLLYFLLSR